MDAAATVTDRLEACFIEIERQRMAGIPILNGALKARAVGLREWNGHWLCVLVTPWFMNIMLMPQEPSAERLAAGTKRAFSFPAGRFEFIRGEEAAIGAYWMCSLFSPMFEFVDQESAETAAGAALGALFEKDEEERGAEQEMAMIWKGEMPARSEPKQTAQEAGGDGDVEAAAPANGAPRTVDRRAFLTGSLAPKENS